MIKDPGPGGMRLQLVPLDMSFAKAFGVRNPDAYERLLMDVVRGNQTLVHAPRRGRSRLELDRSDARSLGRIARSAQALYVGHLGPVGRRRADRARRPHLA